MLGFLKRKTKPVEESWVMARGSEEGLPVLFRFRAEVPQSIQTSDYSRLVNVYWRYIPGREQGMPGSEDYERMLELENHFERMERFDIGFLVLSITGNSRKEWIWYTRSEEAFLNRLNEDLSNHAPFPIEIEATSDPSWATYRDLLARTRNA